MFKLFDALIDKWRDAKPQRDYFFQFGNGKLYVTIAVVSFIALGTGIFYRIMSSDVSTYKEYVGRDQPGRGQIVSSSGKRDSVGSDKLRPLAGYEASKGGRKGKTLEEVRDHIKGIYKELHGDDYMNALKKDILKDSRDMNKKDFQDQWNEFMDVYEDLEYDVEEKEKLMEEIEKEDNSR